MPAKRIFLDANGWVALLNAREELHPEANRRWLQYGRGGFSNVVTDWIVAETGNCLARTSARQLFVDSVEKFRRNPQFFFTTVTEVLMQRTLDLYGRRPDKTWGLVDCASFVVMSEQGIAEAFTTDRHFEQAGFTCLLPVAPA